MQIVVIYVVVIACLNMLCVLCVCIVCVSTCCVLRSMLCHVCVVLCVCFFFFDVVMCVLFECDVRVVVVL